jgi:hypothetical protein
VVDPFASAPATTTGPMPTSMSFDGFGTDDNWASVSNAFTANVATTNTHLNNINPSTSLSNGLKNVTESNQLFDNSQAWAAFDNGILFLSKNKKPKSKLRFENNKLISFYHFFLFGVDVPFYPMFFVLIASLTLLICALKF